MQPKNLLIVPIALFLVSISVLAFNYFKTGDFILKDIDLKGGTLLSIESSKPIDTKSLETVLGGKYGSVFITSIRTTTGYGANIEVSEDVDTTELLNDVKQYATVDAYTIDTIGSSLGSLISKQTVNMLLAAFILMSLVIFMIYRKLAPTFGIVFASLSNILATLAITSLLGIKINFAGFAGLLMLIAYTVDTNIVLTTKLLKSEKDDFNKNYRKALRTGLTLIATITITVLAILLLSNSRLLVNLSEVLVIGFLSDLPFTWVFNAAMLEIAMERRYK